MEVWDLGFWNWFGYIFESKGVFSLLLDIDNISI